MTEPRPDTPDHIAISKSNGIQIDWKDGHHSSYDVVYLRDSCPCAGCTGSHGTEPRKKSSEAPPNPFQMFQPRMKMLSMNPWETMLCAFPGMTATARVSTPGPTFAPSARAQPARRRKAEPAGLLCPAESPSWKMKPNWLPLSNTI